MNKTIPFILLIAAIGLALVFSGCDDRSVEVPDYYITYLGTDIDTIYADGNAETFATITTVVKDKDNASVIGQEVTFTCNIGQINRSVQTNDAGIATAEFHDLNMKGPVVITAKIANSGSVLYMGIKEAPNKYISRLVADEDKLYADNETATTAEISATVRDSEGNLLPNETVTFNSDLGEITVSAVSNASGVAIATLDDTGETGIATITARIESEGMTINFPFEETPSYTIVSLSANPNLIYADNNLTYSNIRAVVRDAENFAVAGESVRFRIVPDSLGYSVGNLISSVSTDSSGVAETTFWDQEDVGTATIEAIVGTAHMQINVEVLPVPVVETVTFDVSFETMVIDEVRSIRAVAVNENGEMVEDGTLLSFETDKGYFQEGAQEAASLGTLVSAETINGAAVAYLNAGDQSGANTVTAFIGDVTDQLDLTIFPGNPRAISLRASQDTIQVNSNEEVMIRAEVRDRYGNPVVGEKAVSFESTIGSITETQFTNSEGVAEASFSPGLQAGLAEITAVCDSAQGSTVVNVISDDVNQLTYAFPGQVDMAIAGTGGMSTYELRVNLWDMSGNAILDSKEVSFKFVNMPPGGCNFNNLVYSDQDTLTVSSVNGSAVVSVNSGGEAGVVWIKAWTVNDNYQEVSATKSNIVIHAGHPYHIDGGIGEYDTGTNVGSGLWSVGTSAIITDEWGNPVDRGTAVWFSIPDESIDWATVIAEAYIGNLNEDGDSLQGVAFSTITYDGSHTFELLPIQIACGNLTKIIYYQLPLNSPQLDMIPLPGHLDFLRNTTYTTVEGEVQCAVTDGQGSPIHDAKITLYSTRGTFLRPDDEFLVPGEAYWVIKTNAQGVARAKMQFIEDECPAVIPPPNEVPVDITGTIIGTEVTDQTTIILLNYRQ